MNLPAISIIVPVYKTEKYISRCLESLVNQTFRDIEIICVNDGSPDNAPAICEDYAKKDGRIVLLSQTNQGLSAARNTGLLHAHGEYIQFCDSDDFFDLTMCEKMYNVISSTNVDIVVADVNLIYEGIPARDDESYYRSSFRGISTITDETFKKINVFAWNKIYKKNVLEKYGINFPYGLYYEDASFIFKYLMVSKTIYCIGEPLYNYVCHHGSVMEQTRNDKPDFAIDHIYVIRDVAHFLEIHGFQTKYANAFIWMVLVYTGLACIYGGEKTYSKAFETGAALLKEYDFNTIMAESYNRDNIIRIYALRKNDLDMYFSVDRSNEEIQQLKEENRRLAEEIKKHEQIFAIQSKIYDKRIKDCLFMPVLKSCAAFPWYIFKIFCMVYNKPLPKRNITLLLKAYLFFPYYVLKIYKTLYMRKAMLHLT